MNVAESTVISCVLRQQFPKFYKRHFDVAAAILHLGRSVTGSKVWFCGSTEQWGVVNTCLFMQYC